MQIRILGLEKYLTKERRMEVTFNRKKFNYPVLFLKLLRFIFAILISYCFICSVAFLRKDATQSVYYAVLMTNALMIFGRIKKN